MIIMIIKKRRKNEEKTKKKLYKYKDLKKNINIYYNK